MKRFLVLLLVAVAALVAPASASAGVSVGIADQKPDMFTDKRFDALDIKHARLAVPWDAMSYEWQRKEIDRWMLLAKAAGAMKATLTRAERRSRERTEAP